MIYNILEQHNLLNKRACLDWKYAIGQIIQAGIDYKKEYNEWENNFPRKVEMELIGGYGAGSPQYFSFIAKSGIIEEEKRFLLTPVYRY